MDDKEQEAGISQNDAGGLEVLTFGDGDDVLNQIMEGGTAGDDDQFSLGASDGEVSDAFGMPPGGPHHNADDDTLQQQQQQQEGQREQVDGGELSLPVLEGEVMGGQNREDEKEQGRTAAEGEREEELGRELEDRGIEGGEEDMDLVREDEGKNEGENDDEPPEMSEESRAAEEDGELQEVAKDQEGDAGEEEGSESAEPKEELPKVRKWVKKWVSVGHLKVYKWVPCTDSQPALAPMRKPMDGKLPRKPRQPILMLPHNGKASAKDQKALARTQRLMNDNAPITRSVTAAFKEKHQREVEKKAKRDTRGRKAEARAGTRSSSRLRIKESKEIFSKISEDNIITPQRLTQDHLGVRQVSGRKRKSEASDLESMEPDTGSDNSLLEPPSSAPGGGGLITNDVPLALPLPVSLSSDASHTNERRLY